MLTPRQWALYNFLKERGDVWTTQLDIAYALKNHYDTSFTDDKFHDSRARLQITMDIRALNDSDVIQKIIIPSSKGVKIATEDEWQKNIKRDYISVFKKLDRIRKKERKGQMDGQTRLVFKSERDTIEAYLREGDDEQR